MLVVTCNRSTHFIATILSMTDYVWELLVLCWDVHLSWNRTFFLFSNWKSKEKKPDVVWKRVWENRTFLPTCNLGFETPLVLQTDRVGLVFSPAGFVLVFCFAVSTTFSLSVLFHIHSPLMSYLQSGAELTYKVRFSGKVFSLVPLRPGLLTAYFQYLN